MCKHIFAWSSFACFTWNVSEVNATKINLFIFIAEPKQVGSEGANVILGIPLCIFPVRGGREGQSAWLFRG